MLGFSVSDLLHVLLEISPLTNHFAAIAGSGTKAKAAWQWRLSRTIWAIV